MPTLQLYLDDQPADLPLSAADQLRLNSAKADISQLDQRIGELSFTFLLPKTARNNRLLGHANVPVTPARFLRRRLLRARLLADGLPVLPDDSTLRLTAVTEQGYEVLLQAPGVELARVLGELTLQDIRSLRHCPYDSVSDLQDIASGSPADFDITATALAYGNFYGTGSATYSQTINTPLLLDDVPLTPYAPAVLKGIFTDQGYRIEGEPLNDPLWNRMVLAYTGDGEPGWNWATLANHTYESPTSSGAGTIAHDPCELTEVLGATTYTDPDGVLAAIGRTASDYYVRFKFEAPVEADWRINIEFFSEVVLGGYTNGGPGVLVVITDEDGTRVDAPSSGFEFLSTSGSTYYYRNYADFGEPLDPDFGGGPLLHLKRGSLVEFLIPKPGSSSMHPGYAANPANVWSDLTVVLRPVNQPFDIDPAKFCPAMPQKEFLKGVLTLLNADFSLDSRRMVATFSYRNTITPQQSAGAIELDVVNPDRMSFKPAASFGTVKFAWTTDSQDALYPVGGADTTRTLTGAGRTDTKEITLPWAPTAHRLYYRAGTMGSGSFTIPCIADSDQLGTNLPDVSWTFDYEPRLLLLPESIDETTTLSLKVGRRSPEEVTWRMAVNGFDPNTAAPGPLTWQALVPAYYNTLLELLSVSEIVTTPILLGPVRYRQLTPGTIVRLGGLLYRINSVTSYQPGTTKPATLEMIRWVAPSGR